MKKKMIALFFSLMLAVCVCACTEDVEDTGSAETVIGSDTGALLDENISSNTLPTTEVKNKTETTSELSTQEESKENNKIGNVGGSENAGTATKPVSTKPAGASTDKTTPASKPAAGQTDNKGTGTSAGTGTAPSKPAHTACTYDGGKVTANATCNGEGTKTYTCTVCGNTKSESIPKTNHNYSSSTIAASCTANGSTRSACTICGAVQSETSLSALGHDHQKAVWWEPTCTNPGYYNMVCTRCGDTISGDPEPALGHSPDGGTPGPTGDCMVGTEIIYHCTRCGEETGKSEQTEPHAWTSGLVDEVMLAYCSVCGLIK